MAASDILQKLRIAIRPHHEAIHRLNYSRLSLCLPPKVNNLSLYALGLTYYAELYYGLEEAWVSCIGDPAEWLFEQPDTHIHDSPMSGKERHYALLRPMYVPELLRTRRLEADLGLLRSMEIGLETSPHEHNMRSEIRSDIIRRITMKPHLVVAYAWVMYSAILYGGREISALLLTAGPGFWGLSATELRSGKMPCPLSFWHVDDAATVKVRLRTCIEEADHLLTAQEQQDILDEAIEIFNMFEMTTTSLDQQAALMRN
ncbi:hypothetical protein N7448_009704 [Penicillium atrosanguineum]|uniref:Heme oxygenase-like protein n=1 Tax=Penicillium atrosanguineum TaxID=1132637 RepID=A0A9W9U5E6_9EURO|nr:hypothetical protein N7448_009704 [Penicillium atrosanguineum]KAJ5142238.1 hypothetical protein N7526_003233 [Penicillium atrosanguineum]KAJ5320902.1 hypothetical protein N7476_003904 [Penicillium atrosanguineum]